MIGMSSPSSETMCTSTDDCFCQEQVRQSCSPNSWWAQRSSSSARMASKSSSGSWGDAVAKEYLLDRVGAEPKPERLEWNDLLGRDVPEVDLRAERLDEPGLGRLRRRFEDQIGHVDLVSDLVDQAGPHLARWPEDPGGAALARLGDHLHGARVELLLDPFDPQVGSEIDVGIFRPHLGEDGEVARELGDQLELSLARDLYRTVRDLDVGEALLGKPAPVLVQLVAREDGLEECAAADHGRVERAVERNLLLEVARHVGRPPTELHDVDVIAGGVEEPLDLAEVEPLVDDVGQAAAPGLRRAGGEVEKTVKAGQRCPPAAWWPPPGRRGRASCRASRSRPRVARSP